MRRGDVHELAVVARPRVVDEVDDPGGLTGDLRPPGVEAQDEVGVLRLGPTARNGHDAADLLVGVDDLALLAGAHAADVDDVGAALDRLDEGRLGGRRGRRAGCR